MNSPMDGKRAQVRPLSALSDEEKWSVIFAHFVAYDPDTGVRLHQRRNGYSYVLVWGDGMIGKPWRCQFKADSLEEAIVKANKRLLSVPAEDITVRPDELNFKGLDQ